MSPARSSGAAQPGGRRPAFTLLELVLVIVLISALVAFAWPDFSSAARVERLHESARRVRALLALCRAEAMNEARRYRIEVHPDGSVRVKRQLDPLLAPHLYNPVRGDWARTDVLLEDVWVEAVQLLPAGPAPIRLVDERLELTELALEPVPVRELDGPVFLDIEPDGACPSARWVLRDASGRALLLMLDGRLGRVSTEDWPALPPEDVERPEALAAEPDEVYDLEDFK